MVLLGCGKRGARVVRSLGRPDVARNVLEALMLDRGLRRVFPRAVEDEAADAAAPRRPATVRAATSPTCPRSRSTRSPRATTTTRSRPGARATRIRVWVHIADVSAYVRPGSALEHEAFRRATSVYVPGAVEPMLPHALSSEACSLVPGRGRAWR